MALEGRLQVRTYDDNNGQRHWVTEVVADQVEFCGSKPGNAQNNDNSGFGLGEEIEYETDDLPF